jgi:hypothetical protein
MGDEGKAAGCRIPAALLSKRKRPMTRSKSKRKRAETILVRGFGDYPIGVIGGRGSEYESRGCLETGTVSGTMAPSEGEETHASDIDGFRFRRRSQSRLLSKCGCRSGRRSSHEAGCHRRVNGARGAVLRPPHSARHHQVLPGIRCGASGLPPLLSLVVVKPSYRAPRCCGGEPLA